MDVFYWIPTRCLNKVAAMSLETVIGLVAACFTTCSFIPQAWLVIRHQKTEGISLWMYVLFAIGIALWFLYGVLLGSWPIILANGVTIVLVSVILAQKIRLG